MESKEQKGQTLPYMINSISIMLNGRNHRGSLRGRSCGRALAPCKSFMLYYKMFGVDRPNVCNDVSGL